jgi:predicted  nucleic acid-binding Zn-ribbon protein
MTWIFITLIIFSLLGQYILFQKFFLGLKGFEILMTQFIEVNQSFYEGQKNITKKDKELFEALIKQNSELSVLRRHSTQINSSVRSLNDSIKNLKEQQKEIKDTNEELNVSKQIAASLATVSSNIKLLDKVVMDLKKSINDLKRSK